MKRTRIVLLPGLHGTDGLSRSFADLCPPEFELMSLSYPTQQSLSYESLVDVILQKLNGVQSRMILLGESFSGPLALFVANRKPAGLVGVVLAASFVLSPAPAYAKWIPWEIACRFTKPIYAVRSLLSRKHGSVIQQISEELQKVSPSVLADRIRSTLSVDATTALQECAVPILYLAATRDIIVRRSSLEAILAIRNDVVVREIHGPHFIMPSAPDKVWLTVAQFSRDCCAA